MSIFNRDTDQSMDKMDYCAHWSNPVAGSTIIPNTASMYICGPISYPYVLESGRLAAIGTTNSPAFRVLINRFAGGLTIIVASISTIIYGTTLGQSGSFGFSGFAPSGSTLLNGLVGDILFVDMTGSAVDIYVDLVLRKTQDIVTYNNI